ncbi:MAG: alpha-mannosidase [Anaerolineae bacterium]
MFHAMRRTFDKIRQRLSLIEPLVYIRRQPFPPFRYLKLAGPLDSPPIAPDLPVEGWPEIAWGSDWGERNTNFALRSHFQVPPDWDGGGPVALSLPIGEAGDFSHPEALVYLDGRPFASCDRHHQEVRLPPEACDGAVHSLALYGWTGGTPILFFGPPYRPALEPAARLFMGRCQIVQIHQPTRDLLALARVALGVAEQLEPNHPTRAHLSHALDQAFRVLDTREPFDERFYASVPLAGEVLREGIARSGAPLEVEVFAAGHAHIDVAWLWTLGQTRRKAARTFYNVLHLMEQFPRFCFTQSQAQLYDWVGQDDPELLEAIRQRVREGRWEPVGGMWVEADCNLSGGEALVRQFLLGQQFFRRQFSDRGQSPVAWLPDVFGFPWSLPQLIKEAGLRYLFTIKISWSEYNRLPYDSFWWQGLDGTRILTHFSPTKAHPEDWANTYNATASPAEVLGTWTNFPQKDWGRPGVTPPLLMVYGYGDGGGGPTREMMENLGLMEAFPATPRVRCSSAAEFFRTLECSVGDGLPVWNGELYLENHRGTYTTQARNKRNNRKSEFLLHDTEFLAAWAASLDPAYRYPHGELRHAWELVCLNQFHDILPGSSVGEVYDESQQQYAEVETVGNRLRHEALITIHRRVGGDLLVINPTPFPSRDLAFWPGRALEGRSVHGVDGRWVPAQAIKEGWLLDVGELPPYSITPLVLTLQTGLEPTPEAEHLTVSRRHLENDWLRVEFNEAGDMVRVYDKAHDREVLPPGAVANQFQAFEDRPRTPDAWDLDIYYDDRMWLAEPAESVQVVERGPLRVALEIRRPLLESQIVQRISLTNQGPRLDFETTVLWRERHVLLKVAFPVDILAPMATYEIPWGNIQRPTYRNTSWDWARFEVPAQKWVDLSEGGYGVSLLNDCKYGHDIHDHVIRLSLLRSPTEPDPEADQGEHSFRYSLFPHAGGWNERTIAQATILNDPLIVWEREEWNEAGREEGPAPVPRSLSLVQVTPAHVVAETIKQAEDGRGLIVRLYESQRWRGDCWLTTAFPLAEVWRTNLLEENQERLATNRNRMRLSIKPYQIVTLRLVPG